MLRVLQLWQIYPSGRRFGKLVIKINAAICKILDQKLLIRINRIIVQVNKDWINKNKCQINSVKTKVSVKQAASFSLFLIKNFGVLVRLQI